MTDSKLARVIEALDAFILLIEEITDVEAREGHSDTEILEAGIALGQPHLNDARALRDELLAARSEGAISGAITRAMNDAGAAVLQVAGVFDARDLAVEVFNAMKKAALAPGGV